MNNKYKRYRNKLTHLLRTAKRCYYDRLLQKYQSNCKKTWNTLNEIINRRKTTKLPSTFLINNNEYKNPNLIADTFCKYFTNLGTDLAKNVQHVTVSSKSFLSGEYVGRMFFESATEHELVEIINSFSNGVAVGYDNLDAFVIKQVIDLIVKPFTHIVNLSISSGIFPDLLKIARVVPIFKSGDRKLISNYRPVSILPIFSKVLERVIYNRLMSYVDKLHILSENQFGFRRNHSTYLALLQLYNKISSAIDQNEFTIWVFLDLSKAFDTVDHDILLEKLQHYGM